jgi:hypothetical protein
MITLIPIEPLSNEHALLILEAFNGHFVDGGGQPDGYGGGGYGYSDGHTGGFGIGYGFGFGSDPFTGAGWGSGSGYCSGSGDGFGNGDGDGNVPEEWMIDESNRALTGGQNQETLRDKKR